MNRLTFTRRVRPFGLGLLIVVLFVGCQSGMQSRRPDPDSAAQFKYAKQSAALAEMQEREARGVSGSIPSMGAFPLVGQQGSAVSDE